MNSKMSYNQFAKNVVRHSALSLAVETITAKREQSCCVERNYVRRVHDYFVMCEDDSTNKREALKLSTNYISAWEKLHDSCVGIKRPEDIVVCYLSGPEPDNDFKELISLGILPQNIWAFESDKSAYDKAISTYASGEFPQPKIIKQNIETFFEQTPKKFDIVYIDACGSIPSSKHALKCISSICLHHRLNSPGVIISNFAGPDPKSDKMADFHQLVSQYLFFKEDASIKITKDNSWISNVKYKNFHKEVEADFDEYYGQFISAVLRDIPCILAPLQRIAKNPYLNQLVNTDQLNIELDDKVLSYSQNNSLAKYIFAMNNLQKSGQLDVRTKTLLSEIGDFETLIRGLKLLVLLKNNAIALNDEIKFFNAFFEDDKTIYQFLDKPHSNLFFDVIINQLAYPLHYNTSAGRCFKYKAKKTQMFTDITVYDECRYIYEWLPGIHQLKSAFENVSWQYVFRFALDGLVKMRQSYNNEFFFQGAVISNQESGFTNKELTKRENVK